MFLASPNTSLRLFIYAQKVSDCTTPAYILCKKQSVLLRLSLTRGIAPLAISHANKYSLESISSIVVDISMVSVNKSVMLFIR